MITFFVVWSFATIAVTTVVGLVSFDWGKHCEREHWEPRYNKLADAYGKLLDNVREQHTSADWWKYCPDFDFSDSPPP